MLLSAKEGESMIQAQHETKMSRYRAKLRAQGLRPVQIWVPDARRPGFDEECRRQALLVRNSPGEKSELEWLTEAAATIEDWK